MTDSKETEHMVQTLCNAIIMNTGGKANGDFLSNAELNLLNALSLYVVLDENCYAERRIIRTVYQMLVNNDKTELDALFDRLPRSHSAIQPYETFKKEGKIAGNIMVGLANRLSVLQK